MTIDSDALKPDQDRSTDPKRVSKSNVSMRLESMRRPHSPPRVLAALAMLFVLLSGFAVLQHSSLKSRRHTCAANAVSLDRMRVDAERICALRHSPQRASDRRRPNDELLAQIGTVLHEAAIPDRAWQDSVPQPPQRVPHQPYERLSTRLYFDGLTMSQVARLGHGLLEVDPTLTLSAMRISSERLADQLGSARDARWHVELSVSYLVYTSEDS